MNRQKPQDKALTVSADTFHFALYPTSRAVWVLAAGVPPALILAVLLPGLWPVGAAWAAALIGLLLLDAFLAVASKYMTPTLSLSPRLFIGAEERAVFNFKDLERRQPNRAEFRLSSNDRLDIENDTVGFTQQADVSTPSVEFKLSARRRGEGVLKRLWSRWQGPLGLIWFQRSDSLDFRVVVVPDTQLVKNTAIDFFSRNAVFGQKIQQLRGEGSEFDALSEFLPGMDKRAIDWKHSARHTTLLAREYRTERNHNIIFAIDSGYLMCEDMVDDASQKLTKLDRAISASLVMSYVSLKIGDRVGLYAFDKSPILYTAPVAGTTMFSRLQSETSKINYSHEETNYTLGLSFLAQKLKRRSLIVVFTDFIDTTQSELMIETIARLIKKHIVIFVAFRNQPLGALTQAPIEGPDDISRAVIAQGLLSEREIVLTKLAHMGVDVIDADPNSLNSDVVNHYLEMKRRGLI